MTARRPQTEWSSGAAGPVIRLTPVADPHSATWWDFAQCRDTDPEAFFVEKGGSTRSAKALCARCPVQPQCLAYALDHMDLHDPLLNHGDHGVWGGTSISERRAIKRREREAA